MRIIGGKYRRLNLFTPSNYDIRPTTDRCKESLFNVIGYDIIDSEFLDLFAGTGSIGIEAISRDAASVTFVDNSNESISLIKQNLMKINENANVVKTSCEKFLISTTNKFDIIFIDPPYEKYSEKINDIVKLIIDNDLLNEDGYIIIELDSKKQLEFDNCETFKFKKYGKSSFSFVRKV